MPIYEYRCNDCEKVFEEWQSGYEEKEVPCPGCGASSKRLISNTSFVLKGSGWYVTDYSGKTPSGSSESKSDSAGSGDSGSSAASETAAAS